MIYTHFTLCCRNQTFDFMIKLDGYNFKAKPDLIKKKENRISQYFPYNKH